MAKNKEIKTNKKKAESLSKEANSTKSLAFDIKRMGEAQVKSGKKDPNRYGSKSNPTSKTTSTGHKNLTGGTRYVGKESFGKEKIKDAKDLERKANGYQARAQTLNPSKDYYSTNKKKK